MLRYKTYTEMTDFGPYITKLILELPERVRAGELTDTTFHVYAECHEADGSVMLFTLNAVKYENGSQDGRPS